MFGLFLIVMLVGAFGVFICVLDALEQAAIRRQRRREWVEYRMALEAQQAELWPARLQRSVYDQDKDAA